MIGEKLNETPFPEKEDFYSHLNMQDITDAGCVLAKRICKGNIMIRMFKAIHHC